MSGERLETLEEGIRGIKPGARILRAEQGKVPLPLIIDIKIGETGAYQEKAAEAIAAQAHKDQHSDHSDHDHSEHEHHDHSEHHHDHSGHLENDGFMSVSFQSDRPFTLKQFQQFLDNHLPENVFRAKGVLWFQESPARHFFQLTGKRFQLEDDEWSGPRGNQLVFIGRDLDKDVIQQLLENCIAPVLLPA